MKSTMLKAIGMMFLAATCMEGSAATFTSSVTDTRLLPGDVYVLTAFFRIDSTGLHILPIKEAEVPVEFVAGTSNVTLSVDTVTDKAKYEQIAFLGPNLTSSLPLSYEESALVDYMLLVDPGNFPNPPVYKHVMGTYTTRVTYESFTATTPTLTGSPLQDIYPSTGFFYTNGNIGTSEDKIILAGTYKVTGPMTTVTSPFELTYTSKSGSWYAQSLIFPAGSPFGDGFKFSPNRHSRAYSPMPGDIADFVIDDVRVRIFSNGASVEFFTAPEPSTLATACLGIVILAGRCRNPRLARSADWQE